MSAHFHQFHSCQKCRSDFESWKAHRGVATCPTCQAQVHPHWTEELDEKYEVIAVHLDDLDTSS